MFPGGTYSLDAGGNPDAIPSLTYEEFVRMHESFYTSENAYVFLHGKIDLDTVLPLIASYLDGQKACGFEYRIERGSDPITTPETVYFDSEGEDSKCRVYITYPTFEMTDTKKLTALNALITAMTDSNDAPLKKKLLASGIFENVYVSAAPSALYNTLTFEFHGVEEANVARVREILDSALSELLSSEIDEGLISATLDRQEFKLREADFGSCPKGIVYLMTLNDTWLYGVPPGEALDFEPQLAFLREKLNTGYYAALLSEVLENVRTTLILKPSDEIGAARRARTATDIRTKIAEMGAGATEKLTRESLEFKAWQSTPDTEEALSTIPSLSLSDISAEPREITTDTEYIDGTTVLYHRINTNGITYCEMHFDASDLSEDELSTLSLMARTWRDFDTERGTASSFSARAKRALGSISATTTHAKRGDEARCYFSLSFSCLDRRRDEALCLAREYLLEKKLCDTEKISRQIAQTILSVRDAITESGHVYAAGRTGARYSQTLAAREYTHGIEMYLTMKAHEKSGDYDAIADAFIKLSGKLFVKERLTVAITGDNPSRLASTISDMLGHGNAPAPLAIRTFDVRNEGIIIPGEVSYAARGSNLLSVTDMVSGAWSTLSTILNFEILWNEIRLGGGAYGVGFTARANSGVATFRTYRDPSPLRSLDVFANAGERVRAFTNASSDITKFIIGTIGTTLPLTTPAQDAEGATQLYLAGKTHADNVRQTKEILATSRDELYALADLLDKADKSASSTVVGPRNVISAMSADYVIEI